VHPRRGALNKLERKIRLFEEAIRSKELAAAEVVAPSAALPEPAPSRIPGTPVASTSAIPAPIRRHGPRPDIDSHRKVAEVVEKLGPQWKENAARLCESLDGAEVRVSEDWVKKGRESWADGLADTSPENIIKAVKYRLKKASTQTVE